MPLHRDRAQAPAARAQPPRSLLLPLLTPISNHAQCAPSCLFPGQLLFGLLAQARSHDLLGAFFSSVPTLCAPCPQAAIPAPQSTDSPHTSCYKDDWGSLRAGPISCELFLGRSGLPWGPQAGSATSAFPRAEVGEGRAAGWLSHLRGTACAPAGCCRTGTGSRRRHTCRVLRGERKLPSEGQNDPGRLPAGLRADLELGTHTHWGSGPSLTCPCP